MTKKKNSFYSELVFDDAQLALDTANECKEKLAKAKKGLHLSIWATVYNLFGFALVAALLASISEDLISLAFVGIFVLSIASYVLGGGFGTAVKWAWKVAVFGWIIIPFPFDLIVGFMTMAFALMCFFFVPVLFVYINYRQIKKDYSAAVKYLSYYKARTQAVQTESLPYRTSSSTDRYSTSSRTSAGTNKAYGNSTGISSNANRTYTSTSRTATTNTGRTYSTSTGYSASTGRTYGTSSRTSSNTGRTYETTSRSSSTGSRTYR